MTASDFRAELEEELRWRQEELFFFKNQLSNITREEDRDRYRKSLVLILYSHMEGYVKIALQTYIKFINDLHLPRGKFVSGLKAAGMHREFNAYDDLNRKCDVFRHKLPEDKELHKFCRRVDFINQFHEFEDAMLVVEDSVIDTESNLWYVVLQKNLYKVGLPVDLFASCKRDVDSLVNRRNSIAHGDAKAGVREQEFANWESKITSVLSDITRLLYDYVNNQRYMNI